MNKVAESDFLGLKDVEEKWIDAILVAQEIYSENEMDMDTTHELFLETKYRKMWEQVCKYIEPHSDDGGATLTDSEIEQPDPWYSRPKVGEDSYWSRYLELLHKKGWFSAIKDIDSSTRDLIDRIPNPKANPLDVYGMVVGRVQSGKTANFTALTARAVDSGYNLVIVMSGTLNNLRDQTQKRLLRELTGHYEHPRGYHVDTPEDEDREFELLTEIGDTDFDGADLNFLEGNRPMLAVVKKNSLVLEKLYNWLKLSSKTQRKNLKLLMIDDESDYGSVNTNRKKAVTEELRDLEEEEDFQTDELTDKEESATVTNAYVRGILNLFATRAYIGYTATPYANVMIDPNEDGATYDLDRNEIEQELGKTLYPRNFIRLLEKPKAGKKKYIGLDEIFPIHDELIHVVEVGKNEAALVRGKDDKGKDTNLEKAPKFMRQSMADYVICGALKKQNSTMDDWARTHHTMLVHATHSKPKMMPIALVIDQVIEEWKYLLFDEEEEGYVDFVAQLKSSWAKFTNEPFDVEVVRDFIDDIQITKLINSEDDETVEDLDLNPLLDFDEDIVRSPIVGGNLLSRGLTVEGLTTSYFVRSPGTYDSAIQMCRWNGMRLEQEEHLTRVYLTEEMRENYQHLNLVEQDLREEIRHYHRKGLSPSDFAVRVLMHKVEEKNRKTMKPTTANKMAAVIKVDRGIHRKVKQAKGFHLNDPEKLNFNVEKTMKFLHDLKIEMATGKKEGKKKIPLGHLISKNVDWEAVWKFLQTLELPERGFDKEGMLGYFKHMKNFRPTNLESWSVVVIGNGDGALLEVTDKLNIRMPTRTTSSTLGIKELVTPRNLSIDLEGHPDDFQGEDGKFPRSLMWDNRPNKSPLLLLYLLDPYHGEGMLATTPSDEDKPQFVTAPAVVIPDVSLTPEERKELLGYYRLEGMEGSGR